MNRRKMLAVVALSSYLFVAGPGQVLADADDELLAALKSKLKMTGPIDEGKKDNRNNLKTGSVVDWVTAPGDVYIEPEPGKKYKGKLTIHFNGRERKADYVAGAQKGTNDDQVSGKVTATYSLTRDGEVLIKDVQKEGGTGRVGDAVVRHMASLNGSTLK